jgi:translocation and assembly module TamB
MNDERNGPGPASAQTPSASPAPSTQARPVRRWPVVLAVSLVVLALATAAAAVAGYGWLTRTTAGLEAIVRGVDALLPQRVVAARLTGSIAAGFTVGELRVDAGTTSVIITDLQARVSAWSLARRRIELAELAANRVTIQLAERPAPADNEPPATISMPLVADAAALRIGEFVIQRDPRRPLFGMRAIDASLAFGPDGSLVRRFDTDIAGNRLAFSGTMGPRRPFAIEAGGTLVSRLTVAGTGGAPATVDAPVQATFRVSESLESMHVYAGVTGGPAYAARGSVRLRVAPFAPVATQELEADVDGLDPSAWLRGAPGADLQVRGSLKPRPGADYVLTGPVQVTNRRAGAWNDGRIPARELGATLTASATSLRLAAARAELLRGTAAGEFDVDWSEPKRTPRWKVDVRLDAVDPSALDTRARSLTLDGALTASSAGAATRVLADVRARAVPGVPVPLHIDTALTIDESRVSIEEGRVQINGGVAELTGEIGLRDAQPFAVRGRVSGLDPGVLVKGVQARLNAELSAEGTLQPSPRATITATLGDSVLQGRPLRGRVRVDWSADDVLHADADLAVRSASLKATGSLGGGAESGDRRLELAVEAPAVEDLGVPLRGAVSARATLTGDWRAPAVTASATGRKLALGDQRVGEVTAQLAYGGGADGTLDATLGLSNHVHPRGGALSLARATATVKGTLSRHAVNLTAHSADEVPVTAAAEGGWRTESQSWSGRMTAADIGKPFDVRLNAPADVSIAATSGSIGPLALQIQSAQLREARVEWRDAAVAARGRFDSLTIRTAGDERGAPLTLRGEWDLRAAEALDGRVLVERVGGDVYTGTATRRSSMGLTELRVEANVRAGRVAAQAMVRGTEAGVLTASLRADLENDAEAGWRLAPRRPWSGELDANVPSLAWVNPFLSANLRENVRVGGALVARLQLAGTPAAPRASGTLEGRKLRVSWIEQGVRLDNGLLHARLVTDEQGNTDFVLDDLAFSDQPRLIPADRRITQVINKDTTGSVTATGRVKWPELDGVVQFGFDRFPLTQRRDRWLIATGGGNLVFSPKRVQLNGTVVADAGYIDVSRGTAPSLSDDVVVVRATDAGNGRPRTPEPRIAFGMDLWADLGRTFVLRGNGIDTRVTGTITVRHEGRTMRATGAMEAQDGIYEGYGQKLSIERGRVTFQGPIDNPGLDILALRRGLPVEVGVTITRTAANPLVRLHSDPPMADFETLSWLVLGRPAEESRGDSASLARAAIGLLGGSGEGIPTQLARRLGIDEFTIRAADTAGSGSLLPRQSVAGRLRNDVTTVGGEVVSIGKRLSDALTLTYEQATTGTSNIVQLNYQLSRRLSLIARAGTENALDLVYSIAFD